MANNREELLQSLIEKMRCVTKSMHAKHGFPFGEFQLSRPHVIILFYIAKHKEGASSKDLAALLNVTSGAITQFIDTLVEEKLIKREEDSEDRRILRMTLTKTAVKKFAKFKKNYYKSVSPLFGELNEKEIKQFIVFLNKIKKDASFLSHLPK
jgi:DNA-binding MarR family transcriptional regulator